MSAQWEVSNCVGAAKEKSVGGSVRLILHRDTGLNRDNRCKNPENTLLLLQV